MTRVGRFTLATTLAIEWVLPEPVTPRSTMWRRVSRTRRVRAAIACGWSPRGEYSDDSWNTAPGYVRKASARRGGIFARNPGASARADAGACASRTRTWGAPAPG